jgi:outer membrane lipoprotein-sorting protein
MPKSKLLLLSLSLFFTHCLNAQTGQPIADPTHFFNKLRQVSESTTSIRADFTEEKFLSYLKEPAKATGVFYYKKANMLRWEKIKPTPYVFLVNGDRVKIKDNNKEKDISSFNEGIGKIKDLMIILVNGDFQNNKLFTISCFKADATYQVKLIPRNKRMAKVFDYILLTFAGNNMRLKELDFFEKSGDKSVMKFFNDVINVKLDDNLFLNF